MTHETRSARHELVGRIAGAGFASGDRVVIGQWEASPLGPFTDIMWATPDDLRILFAPDERVAAYVTSVYGFDRVVVGPVQSTWTGSTLAASTDSRGVTLTAGRAIRLFVRRPAWFTRFVEGPVARLAMGVSTYGVSPTGVREWYRADSWRRVRSGEAQIGDVDLGDLVEVDPPCGFGFSEPPKRPSITEVRPLLVDPSGRLALVADR